MGFQWGEMDHYDSVGKNVMMGKSGFFVGKSVFPVGKSVFRAAESAFPGGNNAFPVPWGKVISRFPMGKHHTTDYFSSVGK